MDAKSSSAPILLGLLATCGLACGGNAKIEHMSVGASASVGSARVPIGVSSGTTVSYNYRESNGVVAHTLARVIGVLGLVGANTDIKESWSPDGKTYTRTTTITDRGSVDQYTPAIQLDFDISLSNDALGGDTKGRIWHLTYPVVNHSNLRLLVGIGGGSYEFSGRERTTLTRQGAQLTPVVVQLPTTKYSYSGFPVRLEFNGDRYSAYWQAELNVATLENSESAAPSPVSIGLTRTFFYAFKMIAEVTVDRWREDGITLSLGGSIGF